MIAFLPFRVCHSIFISIQSDHAYDKVWCLLHITDQKVIHIKLIVHQ